jgi:hypothetical protein
MEQSCPRRFLAAFVALLSMLALQLAATSYSRPMMAFGGAMAVGCGASHVGP